MIARISVLQPVRGLLRNGARVGAIGVLLLVAVLVLLLGRFGLGPAGGGGPQNSSPSQAEVRDAGETPPAEQPLEDADVAGVVSVPTSLDVWVEEREYLIADPAAGGRRRATLEEILQLASQATGDADGVRVRIRRMPSARVTAWMRLYEALMQAGLPEEAVRLTDASGQR